MNAYLRNGRKVEIVEKLSDGQYLIDYCIEIFYGDETYEELSGRLEIVSEIFDAPPSAVIDNKITDMNEKLDALRAEVTQLRSERQGLVSESDALRERVSKHAQLENVFDFIDGKVTHYVVYNMWHPKILRFEDAVSDFGKRLPRLLTLYGQSDGDLSWMLGQYSDNSGGDCEVCPCLSHEEAIEKLSEFLQQRMDDVTSKSLVKIADEYGISVTDEYRDAALETGRESVRRRIADKESEIAKLREEIEDR